VEEAYYRLGEALEATGGDDEAAVTYRTLTIKSPVGKWGVDAQKRLDVILPKLSPTRRTELTTFNATEQLERATGLYEAMRNPESAAAYAAAASAPGITPEQTCEATYYQGDSWFKERNRTKAAPLFDAAMKVCATAGNVDLQIKAGYQAGRSYRRLGNNEAAAERYARAEKVAAANRHSYADDARLREAEEWAEVKGEKAAARVTELLSNLPDLYPDGDMRAEAMWRLAWRAYTDKDYAQAVTWLKKQIATKPLEDKYYAEGQPQYWLGRTYAKLGKTDESIAAYEETVRKYPLTYYALLALNRLREQHPKRFESLVKEIQAAPADYDANQPAFTFEPRAIYAEVGFKRAIEFLRLGIGWAAEWELAKLGLTPPDGKEEVTDPDQREMLWAMAFLQHNAGRYEPSHWVTRWHVLDYKRQWPVGANEQRWIIGYPQAFWSLVEKYATQHGYPMALQIGIVREESAFDPLRESWANAIGLTQMIYPTAIRFAKGTGIEVNRDNLRDPENNVIIGSNFLVFLWKKWDAHTALVPPSYNAGENAVARWLRERGTWDVDEWSESIPGDQARNYSKRVLASYFVYSYLYGRDIPVMRNDIPKDIIPAARKRSKPSKPSKKTQTNY
jgi:soluble lytic murein transglycosylase